MSIKITVTGDTPLEALSSLAAFGARCMVIDDVARAANQIYEAEMSKDPRQQVPRPEKAKVSADLPPEPYIEDPPFLQQNAEAPSKGEEPPADPAPAPQPAQAADSSAAPGSEPKPPKLEEVRAAGIAAAKTHGQAKVKKILEKYGAPNMTSLAEGDRAAFLEDLKGLGGIDA